RAAGADGDATAASLIDDGPAADGIAANTAATTPAPASASASAPASVPVGDEISRSLRRAGTAEAAAAQAGHASSAR
ncbi:hypothetical protein, partial [Lysobacter enzymogenes]|uniref:hypothetical protein n=1 Tax=Lysobacter enzymogenes TaxID=69 RepID=UPI003D189654